MLQQAIGGVEGEIRVCMQYFFQAWGSRGPAKYRDMLLNTATEEIAHIEFLATAVAMNLQDAPVSLQEEISKDPIGGSVLNGMDMRHTMHQEQWLAVLEELGPSHLPVPNSFPQSMENKDWNYSFVITTTDGVGNQADQPWTTGTAPDGKGKFNIKTAVPLGHEPNLGFGRPDTYGQKEQSAGTASGMVNKVKDTVSSLVK